MSANAALRRWLELGGEALPTSPTAGEQGVLIERLLDVARRNPDAVEADVQIALGVLFNATEVSDSIRTKV